jgi:hypothetical protein
MSSRPYLRILTTTAVALSLGAASFAQLATPTHPPTLKKGDTAAVIETTALDGAPRTINYPKGKITVLLFFMSSCHVCHGMIPEWNEAYARRTSDVDIVGVMVDEAPAEYLTKLGIQFPIVKAPANFRDTFKVFQVPQTVRVLPGGIVDDIATGHIDAMRLGELVRPPDRTAPAKAPAKSGPKKP